MKLKKLLLFLALAILMPGIQKIWADYLVGFNPAVLHFVSKEASGIYRTPASSENVELFYSENLFHYGIGFGIEIGFLQGKAGMRIEPSLFSSEIEVPSANFTVPVYDLLGFRNDQAVSIAAKKPSTVIIRETSTASPIIFKYNIPNRFATPNKFLEITNLVLQTANPWAGIGPMLTTVHRNVEAVGLNEFSSQTFTDFYFIIGGGFNVELHKAIKQVPRNIIISLECLFTTNLTAENSQSPNDDNMNFSQGGLLLSFGIGYKL